jgi:hypothetical protein
MGMDRPPERLDEAESGQSRWLLIVSIIVTLVTGAAIFYAADVFFD